MTEASRWRELLTQVISDSKERQRIVNELGVSPITLTRWASGISSPRPQNIRHLLNILPSRRHELEILLRQEFPDFSSNLEDLQEEIPSAFYDRVLSIISINTQNSHYNLSDIIMHQILTQLDPNRLGMHVTIVRCMPPGIGGKIRSLSEVAKRSSSRSTDDSNPIFLGIESLGGHAVTSGRLTVNQDTIEDMSESSEESERQQDTYEKSAVAYPIMRGSRIAGCLTLSSTQPNYFSTSQLSLVKSYANLIAVTPRDNDFYPLDLISLLQMPPYDVQKSVLNDFRQRRANRVSEAQSNSDFLTLPEAELLELKKMETELIQRNVLTEQLEN